MTIVKQKFNPPLRICKNRSEEVCSISERLWYAEENTDELKNPTTYIQKKLHQLFLIPLE